MANSSSDVCKALKESPDINEINQLLGKQGKSVKDGQCCIIYYLTSYINKHWHGSALHLSRSYTR